MCSRHSGRIAALSWIAIGIVASACSDSSHEVARDPETADSGADDAGASDASAADASAPPPRAGVSMRLEPLSEGFYAQPWPLATRLREDGTLELDGFPLPMAATFILDNLETVARTTHGFSTNGAIFASFDGTIDPDTLPTPAQSLEAEASIVLIEVGQGSDSRGERTPISCSFTSRATGYAPANLLACAPFPGFPLRPAATYALVMTDALLDRRGDPLRRPERLQQVLDGAGDSLAAELVPAYAPLVEYLSDEDPDLLERVVGATVFDTQDPLAGMRALAEDLRADDAPAPNEVIPSGLMLPAESGNFTVLEGTYDTPIYQQGQTPYLLFGGDIQFTEEGEPRRAGEFPVRYALTVPEGEMPEGGWPVVLYAHGTGGSVYNFIEDGSAFHIAEAGVATISIDAPVHGTRSSGIDPSLSFFNITNVLALRDNVRQGAVDLLVLERFAAAFSLAEDESPTGAAIRFDPERIFAMGHSQGSLILPVMLPFSEHVKGVMLSGAGASITASILYKRNPVDIPSIARMYLALEPDERLDPFHPALTLLQAFSEVSDPCNYAPHTFLWPGGRGVDVWVTQGLRDVFAPPEVTNPLITAYGLSPIAPVAMRVEGLQLRGLTAVSPPVSANREAADGDRYTAVYSQYASSDHFLIMENRTAEAQLTHWFESLAQDGRAEFE